jgi:ketosteroid isomerase-like protein
MASESPGTTGLMQVSREWAKTLASRDVDKIVSFWAEDAVVMPPDLSAIVGRAAIRDYVAQSLATPGFSIAWEPEHGFVSASGDLGYLIERSRFTFPDGAGSLRTQMGKTLTIWRKSPGGPWQCVADIWNSDPPPPAPLQGEESA